ncbi:hypothetical protein SGLAM104S_04899 [Streptomyces glaucescens]
MGGLRPPSPLSDNDATDELTVDVFQPDHAGPARLGHAAKWRPTQAEWGRLRCNFGR